MAENAVLGTTVGLTARALDADAGDTVSYVLTNDAGGRFAINASTGVVSVADDLDFETATSHQIAVRATSSGGSVRSANFTIGVTNVNDPLRAVADVNNAGNSVAETAAIGTLVGLTARALDPDAGDTVTYALSNSAGGRFGINPTTGVVSVAGPLDFETATSHQIIVRATSSGGDFRSALFTIAVRNADDPLGAISDGARSDTLTGRGGNDVFIFTTETRNGASERDTITDFAPGDRLDLRDAQILREVQVSGTTVLTLDGDRDQIRLTGLSDFDPDTMLV